MNNNQNIYLDKVIEFLVRDTNIDYKNEKIKFPSSFLCFSSSFLLLSPSIFSLPNPPPSLSFSSYCKEVYGLTDQEMEYVWKEYKSIIKDKINEG
jgi:hypothetical protein